MEAQRSVAPSDLNLTKNSTTLGPAALTSAGTSIVSLEVIAGFPDAIRTISEKGYGRIT
jgi:hypothetical protein